MFALLACLPTAAFQVDAPALPLPARLNSGAAIQSLDGDLWAFGPDYKARLSGPAIEFVPALGERAPHNLPLTVNLVALERGGERFAVPGYSLRSHSGQRAERQVSAHVVEQLEVEEAGVELSYLFTERPSGDGDLVLRLALSSELPLSAEGADGLTFSFPELGGVHIGAVTGIDARGQRASGGLRLVQIQGQRQLELSLPDAFVDQAEFPLLLDPLISAAEALDPTLTFPESNPDAIWSQSGNRWAASWEVTFSATDHDIRARTLAANGTLLSPVMTLEAGTTTLAKRPQIAAFDVSNRLLVLWHQPAGLGGSVICRSTLSDLTSLSNLVTVQSSGGTAVIDADVAGRRTGGQSGLALWMFASAGGRDCRSRSITVPAVGDPTLGVTFQLASGDLNLPRLARFPDQQGRFLAAWRGLIASTPTLFAARLASSGAAQVNPSPIGIAGEILSLDLDHSPDAAYYLFTLCIRKNTPSGLKQEQISEIYTWTDNPPFLSGNFIFDTEFQDTILNAQPQGDLPSAGVLCGQSAFVTRATVSLGQPGQWSQNLQRYARATGQLISSVGAPVSDPVLPTGLASRSNGENTSGDELLLLFSTDGNVFAQAAEIYGKGQAQLLGGDCGSGGQVQWSGPAVIGSPGLVIGSTSAPLGALAAVLNVAYLPVPLTCGTCVWNPLQVTAVQPVIGQEVTPVVLPIPLNTALLGKAIELQWTMVGVLDSPCSLSPNVSVSDRVLMTIGE